MPGEYLLDTTIAVAYLAGEQPVVDRILAADTVDIPTTVLGELYFGAYNSTRVVENIAKVKELLTWARVPMHDVNTADYYGQVKAGLRTKGRPIPDNDI